MAKRTHLLTAVCVAAAAGLFSAGSLIAQNNNLGHDMQMGAATFNLPAGITPKQLNSDKGIEKAFQSATNYAIDKTGFDNIVGGLVDQDRVRMKDSLGSGRSLSNVEGDKNKGLADVIADLQATWQSKYNTKFDENYKDAFTGGYLTTMTGEVSDSNQLLAKWPLDPGKTALPANAKFAQNDVPENQKVEGGDVNLEKGRNVAIARITGVSQSGPITASMISEAGGWKFDVPNTMTADDLYRTLVANLQFIDQQKGSWSTDVNEEYRHVTDAVVASLYGINISGQGGTANNR